MASVYALRLFIRAMHNRVRDGVDSREIALLDSAVLVPLVAVILFFAVYPQLALQRSEGSVKAAVAPARAAMAPTALAANVSPRSADAPHSLRRVASDDAGKADRDRVDDRNTGLKGRADEIVPYLSRAGWPPPTSKARPSTSPGSRR